MADDFGKRFPPSITAGKLYEKTSAKGNSYLTGRLGGLKVAIIKTNETSDDGAPIWEMRFSAAPPSKPKIAEQIPQTPSTTTEAVRTGRVPAMEPSGFGTPIGDEIPY